MILTVVTRGVAPRALRRSPGWVRTSNLPVNSRTLFLLRYRGPNTRSDGVSDLMFISITQCHFLVNTMFYDLDHTVSVIQ